MNPLLRSPFFKYFLLCCFGWFASGESVQAQLPTCATSAVGYIYYHSGSALWQYNPTLPISATNPSLNTITMPSGSGGLAVSANLNAASPSPTFYTTVGGFYYYYNGVGWTNTGHSVGNAAAVNLGAGGGYIYNLVGGSGDVYKYDGTGNGSLLTTVTGFAGGGPYDLQGDCAGNWYILNTSNNPTQYLRQYSPAGLLLQSWTLTGAPNTSAGGGFGIVNGSLYYHNNTPNLLGGPIVGGNINVSVISATGLSPGPQDFGSCEIGGITMVQASIDTGYYCGFGPGVPISAIGTAPFTWTVINGNAVLSSDTGTNITVTSSGGISTIVLTGTGGSSICASSGASTDTVRLIVPTANIDAGFNDTIRGCGTYIDTLNGTLFNTTAGITYGIAWSPAGTITAGINTLTPVVQPTGNITYYMTVSTPPNKGGCTWTDSVKRFVKDLSVKADFNYSINWGCSSDTIILTNTSTGNPIIYRWDFNDGSGSTKKDTTHIYYTQANHDVKLFVTNIICRDSITRQVDTRHPLDASFTVDDDSVCQQQTLTFTNTSVTTTKNGISPQYFWDFGDGGTSNLSDPIYTYTRSGIYQARLVVKDFVPCIDTYYHTIVVDSIPFITFTTTDTAICEGQGSVFTANYLMIGNTGITWDFGDGTIVPNMNPVNHSYDTSGLYTVKVVGHYRLCPDTSYTRIVNVTPFPGVNLGPDTVLCPNGNPIVLIDFINAGNPAAKYLWNTGDTTAFILVNGLGTYWARVSVNGCSATDSIVVNKNCYIDVPNSFTPNKDGLNDYFLPRQVLSRGVTAYKMQVFNRWGQIIFETNKIDGRGWDGTFNDKDQPQGVYVYLIDVMFINGVKEHYSGNVTLLR